MLLRDQTYRSDVATCLDLRQWWYCETYTYRNDVTRQNLLYSNDVTKPDFNTDAATSPDLPQWRCNMSRFTDVMLRDKFTV